MNRTNPVARSRSLRPAGLTALRLIATLAMLLGTGVVGARAAGAQSSGDSFEYDEDGLNWSISWDDSIWSEGGGADDADFSLEANNSIVQFLVLPDANEDPAACLEALVPGFEDGAAVTDAADFEDDNGDPVADDTDDYAYEIRSITADVNGADLDADVVHACYALDRSALLWVVALVPADSGELEDVFDLYDSLEIAGDPVELGLADAVGDSSGSGDETPEASPSDEETPEASPSRRSSPSEEASPSRRSSPSEEASPSEDEATPEPGDGGDNGEGADEAAGTYTSPSFGYGLEWNPDDWDVDQEIPNSGGRDRLDLFGAEAPYVIYIEGSDEWSDPDDCVSGLSGEVTDFDPDSAEPVEDANGDPFEVSEDDRALAAYVNSSTDDDTIALFECRADPDSDLIVAFTFLSGDTDDFVDDVYPNFEDVADSLTFEGGAGDATPEASASEDATPEASRRGSDDATPEASDSDDATPEASDNASDGSGVDGNTYVSPTYRYVLSWDEDVWTVEDESSEDGVDALSLSSDLLALNLTGYNSSDGDIATCFDNFVDVLDDRGDGDATILIGDDGDPIGQSDDTNETGQRYISYSVDGDPFGSIVTCISLGDEDILALEFTAVPDDLLSDDANDQINEIFSNLVYF